MARKVFGNGCLIIDPSDVRIVTVVPYKCPHTESFSEDDGNEHRALIYLNNGDEIPVDPDAARELIEHIKKVNNG